MGAWCLWDSQVTALRGTQVYSTLAGKVQIICANTKVEEIRLWEMVDQDEEGENLEQ